MKVAFVCPSCRTTITAPASLQGASSPCPKCKAIVDPWPAPVNPPAPPPPRPPVPASAPAPVSAPAVVRVVPPPVEQAIWHYSANGARRGPVTTTQLRALVESGVLRANDLLWREGMPAWVEAATLPELFPAGAIAPPPVPMPVSRVAPPPPMPVQFPPLPPPPPQQSNDYDDDDRRSRRDDRQAIQVNVHQVVEREEEERQPRRGRRREGFRCPFCGSTATPIVTQQVSGAGWAVFVLLLLCTIIFCFIGLFIKEDVRKCRDCGAKL